VVSEYITPFRIFAMYDGDKKSKAPFEITEDLEEDLQNKGYGIFWVVNEIEGDRKAENCKKINYWFCDIDSKIAGSKEKMLQDISNSRIKPTHIIETKNGFHCYWRAKNATIENWKKIEEGLVKKFNADPARTDLCGLLRKPYSAHLKDYEENEKNSKYIPFCIRYLDDTFDWIDYIQCDENHKLIAHCSKEYDEKTMLNYFEIKEIKREIKPYKRFYSSNNKDFLDEKKWNAMFDLKNWGEGNRNNNFARITLWLKDEGLTNDEICHIVFTINQKYIFPPLPENELKAILRGKGIIC